MIVLRGRAVTPGIAEGEALVTRDTISGRGGVDPRTGTITERRHELVGQGFAGKVLVFPGAKGSSGLSHSITEPDRDPLAVSGTGDHVVVDAGAGEVRVTKRR